MFGCIDAVMPFQRKDCRYFCVNAALRNVRGVVRSEFPFIGPESDNYCLADMLSCFLCSDKFLGIRLFTDGSSSWDNVS